LQALHPPVLVAAEAPLGADIAGCPGEQVNDGAPDGRLMRRVAELLGSLLVTGAWQNAKCVIHLRQSVAMNADSCSGGFVRPLAVG
jgi:hypothetical protein